jgi:ABC-2 type transport system permease protein
LATLPALLGAGASVPVWVSLLRVRPVADPRHPTSADNPTDIVSVLVAMGGGLLAAGPVLALMIWGPPGAAPLLLPLGLLCGAAVGWGGIRLADERLGLRGTEVLAAAGQRTRPPETVIPLKWDAQWYRENRATAWALGLLTVGWIPVIPQGVLVLAFGIDGGWIVAGHLTGGARTAVALAMVAVGGAMLLTGLVLWGRRPQPVPGREVAAS